jgi:hypothetical protein
MKNKIPKTTYDSDDLGIILSGQKENKPVYMKCAYNYYKIKRVIDMGEFYMLESPEEDGVVGLDEEEE